eukprot:2358820-Amphidinium_carterae.1
MARSLGHSSATLERCSNPRGCGQGLGLLEQCCYRGPRAPDRRPRRAQSQVGSVPHFATRLHGHTRPAGQTRPGVGLVWCPGRHLATYSLAFSGRSLPLYSGGPEGSPRGGSTQGHQGKTE